ncbi:hypothetical protein [Cellulomonas sp. PhB143]|uniref:hypothetical protein n=1 Tax=Cellulomonas sp. PhB143 TaxID=2485186 RepID=UPI000F4AA22E|nr:hypothetical protein [Cellulomonas sp. PhB143]ROS75347.1 hypothetical protein EDF32_1755 [Cellulomonas sp. PhB143]
MSRSPAVRRASLALALGLALGGTLAGCGSDDAAAPDPSAAASTDAALVQQYQDLLDHVGDSYTRLQAVQQEGAVSEDLSARIDATLASTKQLTQAPEALTAADGTDALQAANDSLTSSISTAQAISDEMDAELAEAEHGRGDAAAAGYDDALADAKHEKKKAHALLDDHSYTVEHYATDPEIALQDAENGIDQDDIDLRHVTDADADLDRTDAGAVEDATTELQRIAKSYAAHRAAFTDAYHDYQG